MESTFILGNNLVFELLGHCSIGTTANLSMVNKILSRTFGRFEPHMIKHTHSMLKRKYVYNKIPISTIWRCHVCNQLNDHYKCSRCCLINKEIKKYNYKEKKELKHETNTRNLDKKIQEHLIIKAKNSVRIQIENVRMFCSNIISNSSGNIIEKLLLISANESVINQVKAIEKVCFNIKININYGRCLYCENVTNNNKCFKCCYYIKRRRGNKITIIMDHEQFLKNKKRKRLL